MLGWAAGGAEALSGLGEVALDGLVGGWAVFRGIRVGEAGPGGVVACFDGGKPGGADRETGGGVVVADERFDAWEVVGAVRAQGGGGGCDWEGWSGFVLERDAPKFGSGGFTPAGDDRLVELVVDDDVVAVEADLAAGVAEGSDTDKGVGKGGHDVAFAGGEGREFEVAGSR